MPNLTDRYSVEAAPNDRVVVELADDASILVLTPTQARTLATKLRNAAFSTNPLREARAAMHEAKS